MNLFDKIFITNRFGRKLYVFLEIVITVLMGCLFVFLGVKLFPDVLGSIVQGLGHIIALAVMAVFLYLFYLASKGVFFRMEFIFIPVSVFVAILAIYFVYSTFRDSVLPFWTETVLPAMASNHAFIAFVIIGIILIVAFVVAAEALYRHRVKQYVIMPIVVK